ncbi:Nicotinamide N-methyltransferase [Mizuhopecten yessoensis]|uniref:Nicotinamide N-methyltransferase n=2 Tax=Mizuhopecten yessoensis TaxID=6573 RepID=A0A210QHT8_MIZYE|nr:Nicotinamide N-methyltransferase [Mizuhopecten yessoensis]
MEYVIKKENSNECASSRQNSIRNKVRGILSIDVHLENPLGNKFGLDYFDVIISSLCLEVASESLEDYTRAMRNMCGLLKPGGHLVLVGLCGQSFYQVGDKTFSSLPLRLHQVEDTLEHLGNILLSMRWIKTQESKFSDTKGAFVIVAQRSKKP